MGKLIPLLLVLLLMSVPVSAEPLDSTDYLSDERITAVDPEALIELEAFFDGMVAIQMDNYRVPGVAVAVIKDGQIAFTKGYGYADLETKTAVDPNVTLFRSGSNSKLFVWTAVMQLVEQGRLDLAADINIYLDFTIPGKLANGQRVAPITLTHLLTHTPGFEDSLLELFVLRSDDLNPLGEYLQENLPGRVFPPGEIVSYSNFGTSLAAYIVERVTGQPFAMYARDNIFTPLGMEHSTFEQPVADPLRQYVAKGYAFQNGRYVPGDFEWIQSYPAGSISASTTDMARFMLAQLRLGQWGDTHILQQDTALAMQRRQFSYHPKLTGMTYGFFESEVNGRRVLSHGGNTIMQHAGLFLLPEEQAGLYIVYNGKDAALARNQVFTAFMDRFFPASNLSALEPNPRLVEEAHNYQGIFYYSRSNFTSIESFMRVLQPVAVRVDEEGYLLMPLQGTTLRLTEVEPGIFSSTDREVQLVAVRDDSGRVVELRPNLPYVLIRTPWYGHPLLLGVMSLGALVLFLASTPGWVYRSVIRTSQYRKKGQVLARMAGIGFAVSFGLFLILLGGIFGELHPVYGVPNAVFGMPSSISVVYGLAVVLSLLGSGMMVNALLAWARGYWSVWGRLHYTVVSVWGFSLAWVLYYLNFLNLVSLLVGVGGGIIIFGTQFLEVRGSRNRLLRR